MVKLVIREIRAHFGRWLAILAIIALGSGFLSGLIQTAPAMLESMKTYLRESVLYDWRVVLPGGVDDALADTASDVRGVRAAESAAQVDALCDSVLGEAEVLRIHSLTERVNLLTLRAGRLPQRPGECVADDRVYTEADLGTAVCLSDANGPETRKLFLADEFTIVGLVSSPLYLNFERGSSALGSGKVEAFLYLPRESFAPDARSELYLALDTEAEAYSDSYDRILRLTERRLLRFAEQNIPEEETDGAYVLSRKSNVGYVGFESDAGIVAGIARVFPVFFFLVAALVCICAMTRMVDEQRTQIGVLRAMGFGTARIAGIYLLYASSASVLGCVSGFFAGSAVFPRVIWKVYGIMYQTKPLRYGVDLRLGGVLTAAFTALSCLATYLVFRREDRDMPAQLLRPRPPKAGRRSLLERLPGLTTRLGAAGRVTLRNLLRDYGRLLMTVVGVAGCTALLLTGYGIRDSVGGIADLHFAEVARYDYLIAFSHEPDAETLEALAAGLGKCQLVYQGSMDIDDGETLKSATVIASREGSLDGLMDLHSGSRALDYPQGNEALICTRLAEVFGLAPGDPLTLRDADGAVLELTVSGVFDNYIYNYVVISTDAFAEQWGGVPELRTAFARAADGGDIHRTAAELLGSDDVLTVIVSEDAAERVSKMMEALDYIVWLVIASSGALAFIVVYNMTDINIIERLREIATVKVLGFYPRETAAYVFRENLVLAALGALLGLPVGKLLHAFVIRQIKVDLIYIVPRISPASYLYAVAFTFLFVAVVDLLMHPRLERIHMAEALKSVE